MSAITDYLDHAQARTDAATDGPWEAEWVDEDLSVRAGTARTVWNEEHTVGRPVSSWKSTDLIYEHNTDGWPGEDESPDDGQRYYDAEFIAAARTDLPATIAALRAVLDLASDADSDATLGAGEPEIGYIPTNHLREVIATALGVTE